MPRLPGSAALSRLYGLDKGVEMFRDVSGLKRWFPTIALIGLSLLLATNSFAQNVKGEKIAFVPPGLSVIAEPSAMTVCADEDTTIRLRANANSPRDSSIHYRWRVSDGRIIGEGAIVSWDLSGLIAGSYKASVDIETGNGDGVCEAFSSTTIYLNECPAAPVCPTVTVASPQGGVKVGRPLDFQAAITGGNSELKPIYNWTVSSGSIVSGQGTTSIRVDTTGLAGQSVVAKVSLAGYPIDCSGSCVVEVPVVLECRKFDEFPALARNDEKARLDNYAIELQNDPSATAYVVVHAGKMGRAADVQKHTTRITDYLINSRAIDGHRIVTLVGSVGPQLLVELWVCPQGATPPAAAP
jgi:PKD domain-containing protein